MQTERYLTPMQYTLIALFTLAAALLGLLLWQASGPLLAAREPQVIWAAPVEPLQPTPAIAIPPGAEIHRAQPQISNSGGDVTIVNNVTVSSTDVDVCVALVCPPASP